MIPNDLDATVPRDLNLALAVEQLKTAFAQMRRFNFVELETKGPHVELVLIYFTSLVISSLPQ